MASFVLLSASLAVASTRPPPSHLVVLAHGLSGTSRDLLRLESALQTRDRSILCLPIAGNEGRTKDGVVPGAERVASEVRAAVAANPSLRRISFVGNSLGGLYIRAAACQLLSGGRMAGLAPELFVTIASPHLGTRLLPWCPPLLHPIAPLFAGQTASDLFLRTLALETLTDERHLRALRAFRRRVLYANAAGDLMVQPYTSAIDGELRALEPRERLMANRLRSVPWRTVLVRFRWLLLPISHNMICALSRDPLSALVYGRGGSVADECATAICGSAAQPAQVAPTLETFDAP